MSRLEPSGEQALLALRYAAGELAGAEAEAFEERLATDAAAREVLGETVRLSAAVSGVPTPAPQSGILASVQDRLFPTPFRRLFPTQSYRGHPALWVGLGCLAAGLFALALELSSDPAPQFVVRPMASPVAPALPTETPAHPAPQPDPLQSTTPIAGMESAPPVPQPMPQPRAEMPPGQVETKKG